VLSLVAVAMATTAFAGFGSRSAAAQFEQQTSGCGEEVALYTAMRQLWGDHMQWTYATVDAFFHEPDQLDPTLDRLLANQQDIGAAIVPFYGQPAGDGLAELLTTHINQAVPVLTAAQDDDDAALQDALDDWYANAKEIADYLSAANPDNWPTSATEPMMETHITQTTGYSVDLLQGDYAKSITDYDADFEHMMMLSDTLSGGIIAQFPAQFSAGGGPSPAPTPPSATAPITVPDTGGGPSDTGGLEDESLLALAGGFLFLAAGASAGVLGFQ
jgi:hypothetical protein